MDDPRILFETLDSVTKFGVGEEEASESLKVREDHSNTPPPRKEDASRNLSSAAFFGQSHSAERRERRDEGGVRCSRPIGIRFI